MHLTVLRFLVLRQNSEWKQRREERVSSISQLIGYHEEKSGQEVKAGPWRWELEPHGWVLITGLFSMALSACFLQPFRMAPSTVSGLCPPLEHRRLIKKMLYRLAYRQTWWSHFLNWGFLFQDNSSQCQADLKPRRHNWPWPHLTIITFLVPFVPKMSC